MGKGHPCGLTGDDHLPSLCVNLRFPERGFVMAILRSATALALALGLIATPMAAQAAVKIKEIYFDPPGSDTRSKLNQEFVVLANNGRRAVRMTGWTLRDTASHVYRFDTFRLRPGKKVRVHTGSGRDDRNDVYWRSGSYIWNNDGDKATLKRSNGTRVDRCRYTSAAASPKLC
jgi:hypothetical protein